MFTHTRSEQDTSGTQGHTSDTELDFSFTYLYILDFVTAYVLLLVNRQRFLFLCCYCFYKLSRYSLNKRKNINKLKALLVNASYTGTIHVWRDSERDGWMGACVGGYRGIEFPTHQYPHLPNHDQSSVNFTSLLERQTSKAKLIRKTLTYNTSHENYLKWLDSP